MDSDDSPHAESLNYAQNHRRSCSLRTVVAERTSAVYPPGSLQPTGVTTPPPVRGLQFWLILVALSTSMLLTSMDLGAIGTIAPTIVSDLDGGDFTWVGSAYALASSACLPLSGNLAQIFGRRPILVGSIAVFAAGSVVSASARSIIILIVGRAIQGIGGGGIQTVSYMVVADLVPLSKRGMYMGLVNFTLAFGSGIAPFIGGGLIQSVSWRWFFYLNVPICGVALVLITFLLKLRTPRRDLRGQLKQIDYLGNVFLMSSTCSCMIGLTWGGVRYSWTSPQVLLPLIIGIIGLIFSFYYQVKWAAQPTIPMDIFLNKDSFIGYYASFVHGIVLSAVTYYLPAWFQAVRGAGPIMSGLYLLPILGGLGPSAVIQGLAVSKTGKYYMLTLAGWCSLMIGIGLLVSTKIDVHIGILAFFEIIVGLGLGTLYATVFTVLAPLKPKDNATAMALLTFIRTFSQAWGIAIGGAVLQGGLNRKLPSEVLKTLPEDVDIAFAIIPHISSLPDPLKLEVRQAFHQSVHVIWVVLICITGAGLLSIPMMRDIPLQSTTDERWGIIDKNEQNEFTVADVMVSPQSESGR